MAKAVTKKSSKISKVTKLKETSATASKRVTPSIPAKASKVPVAKKLATKEGTTAKKTRTARAPIISKDELRDQIGKLTAANLALKNKNRETAKALRASQARITVLENEISQAQAKDVTAG